LAEFVWLAIGFLQGYIHAKPVEHVSALNVLTPKPVSVDCAEEEEE